MGHRPASKRLSDAEEGWLRDFRAGDRRAFHKLLQPHLASLQSLARRQTGDPHWADDLVQEVLVRAFQGLSSFRAEAALRTWLFRIMLRLAAEPQRWRRGERAQSLADIDVPDRLELLPEHNALGRELRERIDEAMERLSPGQRTALHLRAVEGLDYRSIAEVLECTPEAARVRVLTARRKVLARIGSYLEP